MLEENFRFLNFLRINSFNGGFVSSENKQIIVVPQILVAGGTKVVTHCQNPETIVYEITISGVVIHEIGHYFGLIHTFDI